MKSICDVTLYPDRLILVYFSDNVLGKRMYVTKGSYVLPFSIMDMVHSSKEFFLLSDEEEYSIIIEEI